MRHKLKTVEGQAVYRMRKAIVEPVFGQIKEERGFRRFSFRGKDLGYISDEAYGKMRPGYDRVVQMLSRLSQWLLHDSRSRPKLHDHEHDFSFSLSSFIIPPSDLYFLLPNAWCLSYILANFTLSFIHACLKSALLPCEELPWLDCPGLQSRSNL